MDPIITPIPPSRSAYGAVDAIPLSEIKQRKLNNNNNINNNNNTSKNNSEIRDTYTNKYSYNNNNNNNYDDEDDSDSADYNDIELIEKRSLLSKDKKDKKDKKNKKDKKKNKKKKKNKYNIYQNFSSEKDGDMCNFQTKKRKFRVITDDDLEPKHPPMKTTIVAIFLLFFGASFLLAGFVTFYRWGVYDAIPFWTLGGLTFIPGSYASVILFMTFMGKKGYRYDLIPNYDE